MRLKSRNGSVCTEFACSSLGVGGKNTGAPVHFHKVLSTALSLFMIPLLSVVFLGGLQLLPDWEQALVYMPTRKCNMEQSANP